MKKNERYALVILLILALGLYSLSLPNAFVYDDYEMIVSNTYVHDIKYLPKLWVTNYNAGYLGTNQGL